MTQTVKCYGVGGTVTEIEIELPEEPIEPVEPQPTDTEVLNTLLGVSE